MSDQITLKSKKFYEQYHFPGNRPVDNDGLIFLRKFSDKIKSISKQTNGNKLRVLDAGCGTGNTSVSLSRQFNNVEFFGIDNSVASLNEAKISANKYKLSNIHFSHWDLMKKLPFKEKFDIILSLGVLHHTADMQKVLINISNFLKKDGCIYLWIYGKHGRYAHSLNMQLLQMFINKSEDIKNIDLAKEFIFGTESISPVKDLFGKIKTNAMQQVILKDDVWIADQFLNPHELLIDMKELINIVNSASLEINELIGFNNDISAYFNSDIIKDIFNKFNTHDKLIALDLIVKPERYFVCLKKLDRKG